MFKRKKIENSWLVYQFKEKLITLSTSGFHREHEEEVKRMIKFIDKHHYYLKKHEKRYNELQEPLSIIDFVKTYFKENTDDDTIDILYNMYKLAKPIIRTLIED